MRSSEPVDHGLPGYGWTVPKLIELVDHIVQRTLIFRAKRQPGYAFAGRRIKRVDFFNIPADTV